MTNLYKSLVVAGFGLCGTVAAHGQAAELYWLSNSVSVQAGQQATISLYARATSSTTAFDSYGVWCAFNYNRVGGGAGIVTGATITQFQFPAGMSWSANWNSTFNEGEFKQNAFGAGGNAGAGTAYWLPASTSSPASGLHLADMVFNTNATVGDTLVSIMAGDHNGTQTFVYDNTTASFFDPLRTSTVTIHTTAAVPEPASLAALGLGALALIRRRRAQRNS